MFKIKRFARQHIDDFLLTTCEGDLLTADVECLTIICLAVTWIVYNIDALPGALGIYLDDDLDDTERRRLVTSDTLQLITCESIYGERLSYSIIEY